MTLDFPMRIVTVGHVAISIIGIAAGFAVLTNMWSARIPRAWTGAFLAATAATSATGLLLKPLVFDPPQAVGVLSLLILAITIPAIYYFRLKTFWRRIYVVGALLALYLNVFVAIVQAFQKLDFLRALAPKQTEPPFLIAQTLVGSYFVVSGVYAWRRFGTRGLG
jgi:hypothetical protein